MRRAFATLMTCCLTAAAACADPSAETPAPADEAPARGRGPIEGVIRDLLELRREVGQEGAVVADEEDFAEALRNQAPSEPTRDPGPTQQANPYFAPPPTPRYEPPVITPVEPGDGWNSPWSPNSPQSGPSWPVPAGYNRLMPVRQAGPQSRDPKRLLQHTAAELDRLANDLEVAELYGDADALRETAQRLRESARRGPRTDRAGDASTAPSAAEERYRQRIEDAHARLRQSREERFRDREFARERIEADARRPRGGPQDVSPPPKRVREEAEGIRERWVDDGPPRGVHGGPVDPSPAPVPPKP